MKKTKTSEYKETAGHEAAEKPRTSTRTVRRAAVKGRPENKIASMPKRKTK